MARLFGICRSRDLKGIRVMLLAIGLLFVGVAGAREIGMEQSSLGRRLLAVNLTQNVEEDGEALLLFKAGIVSDPLNVTYWWKRQGSANTLNPCRMRNTTASYWPGISCNTNKRVTAINLSNMSLAGTLSPDLGSLTFLTSLDLSNNLFTGPIPANLTSLKSLNLRNNHLDGILPSSIGNWTNLTSLDVSNNRLPGLIPASIGDLQLLESLNISNNNLTGAIPTELNRCTRLKQLDLSRNGLQGTVPEFQNLTGLMVLNLQENQLQALLPSLFGKGTILTSLDMSNNRLVGAIPASFGNLQLLETINMTNNNLTGTIPPEINLCTRLTQVDLSRNGLQGTVPFQNLRELRVLHLQENELSGDFVATRLDTLPLLEDLDLSNNYLSGSIPATISQLPNLRTQLSLGCNNLSGVIPDSIGAFSSLLKMNLSANGFSGILPDSIGNCVSLQTLDVSVNMFSGLLPGHPLANLLDLVVLNMSKNQFGGGLPLLPGLTSLQVFDASFNYIEGPIPDDFVNFTVLKYLNVSYNQLVGEVPFFVEHDNVNIRSFMHNHVCGVLLNLTCDHPRVHENQQSTIVSIAVGSAIAFVLLFLVTFFCCSRWLQQEKEQKKFVFVSAELELKLTPEQVGRATHNFHELSKMGKGDVYRGVLPDDTCVAVKRLTAVRVVNEGTEKVFSDAFEILSHTRHWSLVKVLGYCISPDVTALVMEYMPNGNLSNALYSPRSDISEVVREFNWHHRFNTAVGVAEGLKYLHHECSTPTVHGNLKPSNILFNIFMEARVSDFGIAKILGDQGVKGGTSDQANHGYKAPESLNLEGYTMKGDVYTFGIIMLEMISGRSPESLEAGVSLPDWIRTTLSDSKALENILDPVLRSELDANQQKMSMALGVALLCTREQPQERPYMTEVLKMLNHIKTRPHDETKGSKRFKSSPSTHKRNEEIRHEVPGIEIQPSPPTTPTTPPTPPHALTVQQGQQGMQQGMHTLSHNPSLSAWTPSPDNR